MLKASGVEGVTSQGYHSLWEKFLLGGRRVSLSLHKRERTSPLIEESYGDIRLLDQVRKVFEMVTEDFPWQQMYFDDMQFGLMPGRYNTDAIFIVHQLQKYSMSLTKHLIWFCRYGRAAQCVPRVIYCFCLTRLAFKGGWCAPYKVCRGTPKVRHVSVAIWVKSLGWKWEFTKAVVWAPYYSSCFMFWKPPPKSFVLDVSGKTCEDDLGELQENLMFWKCSMEGKATSVQHGQSQGPDNSDTIWYA